MVVGVGTIELYLPGNHSLKGKRQVVNSLKGKLKSRFNVSVAEVDHLDSWQRAAVGVAMVSNDPAHVHSCLDKIVDLARRQRGLSLLDYEKTLG